MAAVPKRVSARISTRLRRYQKVLASARDRDINESDTVVIVADILNDVLGFDKYTEITTEFAIRGGYCDLAVKIGGTVQYLIEAKPVGVQLKERHLRQAIQYAAQSGVEWVVLTNAVSWHVYRMVFEQPIRHDLVFELDLLAVSVRDREALERLFLLSREGVSKSAIQEFQEKKDACSPFLIGAILQSDPLVAAIRRELRRISPGARVAVDEVLAVLREEVLKRDVVEGEDARAAGSRVRRVAARPRKRRGRITRDDARKLVSDTVLERPLGPPDRSSGAE